MGAATPPNDSLSTLAARDPVRRLDAAALRASLGLSSDYLAGRILHHLGADGDGTVRVGELVWRVEALRGGSPEDRMRFAFALHDHDGDGSLSPDEIARIVHLSLAESGLRLPAATATSLVEALLARADRDGDRRLSYAEFSAAMAAHPAVMDALGRGVVQFLDNGEGAVASQAPSLAARLRNDWPTYLFVLGYLLATVGVGVAGALTYRDRGANGWVQLARACGWAIDYQLVFILVPALRGLLTRLRRSFLGPLLPLDDAWELHRAAALGMLGLAVVHTLAHVGNLASQAVSLGDALARPAVSTGALWLAVFAVMLWYARDAVRRSGRFELFARTHLLYVPWLGLALAHAPGSRRWVLVPVLLLALERWRRARRRTRDTVAVLVEPLASGVTLVVLARPEGFRFEAGEYIYLRLPAIARGEWHPFTLSSHPERNDLLTVHVRSLGNWTRALHAHALARRAGGDEAPMEAQLDGPYGAPAEDVFRSEVAVLVGAGIGVTPFASVLASLLARSEGAAPGIGPLRRVYFVWVARDQHAFEWFADLLRTIEARDARGLFDLRMWITSARADAAGGTLGVALDLLAARTGRDPITGLRARARFGQPDWDALLDEVAKAHAGAATGVFFCGPHGLGRVVAQAATRRGMQYRAERF